MAKEKWSSLFWLGIAVCICVNSLWLSLGELHNPGPGFLSFCAGAILGVLALVVFLQSLKSPRGTKERSEPIWSNRQRGIKMLLALGSLFAYAVVMNYLGFLVSTILFLTFLLRVIEPQRWSVAIFGSLAASGAFYILFEIGLQSQLPKGYFQLF
jgi:putative tricarboxylic transport membrane protein